MPDPITILAFLFVLTVVVFIHEMGHFLTARFFNISVDAFSIGFGREIFGWNDKHGTRWKVCWIPLGGYVKFSGDENAASMPSAEKLQRLRAEGGDLSRLFHFKPVGQRAAVVFAGPFANFVLSTVVFAALAMAVGLTFTQPVIHAVQDGSPAAQAGFQEGDVIRRLNGAPVTRYEDVAETVLLSRGLELDFEVERGSQTVDLTVVPEAREIGDGLGGRVTVGSLGLVPRAARPVVGPVMEGSPAEAAGLQTGDWIRRVDGTPIDTRRALVDLVSANPETELAFEIDRGGRPVALTVVPQTVSVADDQCGGEPIGRIGIGFTTLPEDVGVRTLGPVSALGHGVDRTWGVITQTLAYVGGIIVGRESADQLGGPIRIAQIAGQAASVGLVSLLGLLALISVSIGLINLFPIPVLDGGHLVYYAYEAVAGKPLSERAQEIGFRIGLALVLALMVFATWNDIMHFLSADPCANR